MNSLVCIACVPDTESRIKIAADGKSIDETDVKWIVSPYDEYGLEEALKIKEAKGAGTVTVPIQPPGWMTARAAQPAPPTVTSAPFTSAEYRRKKHNPTGAKFMRRG